MDTITTLGAIFTSFVICQLIFHFVSSWFSAKVSPRFNDLSSEKKIKWNSRVVSTCEALVVGIFSLCIFLFHEAATVNLHWDAAWLGNVNIAIITGYLISDLLLLLFYWRVIGRIYFVIHSCAALYLCFLVLKEGLPAYIWNIRLIVHLSNLFYYQR
ncbi:TLC domain-containing protein 4-like [Loxodonta africana]|uniref:TLC domain-containing protein 4-like n=1 Tax=Loxodonta africana TaxID=9785 RepID=UPI000C81205E|nr:transmembrane protein 56-like [Loxodonta africana]